MMKQEQTWWPSDQFRSQYAVLAKHVLCQRSKSKLYQLERAMHRSKKMAAEGVKLFLKIDVGRNLVEQAIDLGKLFMKTKFAQNLILCGPIIGITINAALAFYEYNHPELTPTINAVIAQNLIEEEEKKIQSYLQAYLKSYENKQYLSEFIEKSYIRSESENYNLIENFQQTSFVHSLTDKKGYILKTIFSDQFENLKISKKIKMVELYYQLSKSLIEIIAMVWNKKIVEFLRDLEKQHKQIKQKLVEAIRKSIKRSGKAIVIKGITEVSIDDPDIACNEDAFAESIFDQLYRCPVTKYTVDCIYEPDCWTDEFRQQIKVTFEDIDQRIIGEPLQSYKSRRQLKSARIRKISYDNGPNWVCYYENLLNSLGFCDKKEWQNIGNKIIDLDFTKVIYVNSGKICILNSNYESITVYQGKDNKKMTKRTNYCFELSRDQILQYLEFNDMLEMRFFFAKKTEKNDKIKPNCKGYIQTKDHIYRLSYNPRNLYELYANANYDFRKRDIDEPRQQLLFQDITSFSYFPNSNQIDIFTCRISSIADRTKYIVRKSKQSQFGEFEFNDFCEELVRITLTDKIARKNEYYGTMRIGKYQIYLSKQNKLMWKKQNDKQEFYIYFKQK